MKKLVSALMIASMVAFVACKGKSGEGHEGDSAKTDSPAAAAPAPEAAPADTAAAADTTKHEGEAKEGDMKKEAEHKADEKH